MGGISGVREDNSGINGVLHAEGGANGVQEDTLENGVPEPTNAISGVPETAEERDQSVGRIQHERLVDED